MASAALFLLAACGGNTEDGKVGQAVKTHFFDFTVDSAAAVDSYAGYTAADGNQLIDVVVTTKNTFGDTLEMYDTDYQLQWGERDDASNFANPMAPSDDTMAPLAEDLPDGESMTYHYVFEVPADVSDFELCYLEEMESSDNTAEQGNIHFVKFSV